MMLKFLCIITIGLTGLLGSCSEKPVSELELKIVNHKYYANLSSASGVGTLAGDIYIVGDDLPWIFQLDVNLNIIDSTSVAEIHPLVNGRTPSAIKADFEDLEIINENNKTLAIVLSSGSKANKRDTAFIVSILPENKHIAKKNIRPLYEMIKKISGFTNQEEINIEGLTVSDSNVFLFHRGNISGNFIVEIDRKSFLRYITGTDNELPELSIYIFNLPEYKGIASGFSGACMVGDQSAILFTASMEDTKTVTEDGHVSGSYLGWIPLSGIANGEYKSILLKEDQGVLAKKLEGVAIESQSGNKYKVIAVCDNDDGSSDIFELELKIPE